MEKKVLSDNLEIEFFKFVYKRQLIWHKRFVLKEKPPWTEDELLRRYKIINVYRELDKCTLYLLDKLKEIKDREKILINVIFYRFFNRFGLYEDLGIEPFGKITPNLKRQLIKSFDKIRSKGLPIFNNAYIICPGNTPQKKHVTVLDNLEKVSKDLSRIIEKIDLSKSPEESFRALNSIPLAGPFLSCEFWTDLAYLNFFKQGWTDNDFVNIGPGAKWGLEIVYGSKLSNDGQMEALHHLHDIQGDILADINKTVGSKLEWETIAYKGAFSNYPYLSLINIEGSLCEFRKYWNIKHGRGKRRYFYPRDL